MATIAPWPSSAGSGSLGTYKTAKDEQKRIGFEQWQNNKLIRWLAIKQARKKLLAGLEKSLVLL